MQLGFVGTCPAKMIGVDLHLEIVQQYSVWYSVYMTQGTEYTYCSGLLCSRSVVGLFGLNLRSGGIDRSEWCSDRAL